jgi:trans-2,3-dihydro-3-hydroxyanthranilate isomerase
VPEIATCLSLDPADIVTTSHAPTRATLGVDFVFVEVTEDALGFALPDVAAYQRLADAERAHAERLSIFLYAREENRVRARMFSPLTGTWEDPATGSANATLGALLLSLGEAEVARFDVRQGVEMGRPSNLVVNARRTPDGIRASVAGRCVPVFSGTVEL